MQLARPKLNSRAVTFDLSADDASDLRDLLRHCDVLVTSFSTVMLEACIFDRPVVNVAFERYSPRMGQPYTAVANYAHLKRILAAGGTRTATTPAELLECLNRYLRRPETDGEGGCGSGTRSAGHFPERPADGSANTCCSSPNRHLANEDRSAADDGFRQVVSDPRAGGRS
jgi:hypothetical protein